MFTNPTVMIGSSIALLALVALIPEPAETMAGRSLTDQAFLERTTPQLIATLAQTTQYTVARRGLPRRREGGGTRFV